MPNVATRCTPRRLRELPRASFSELGHDRPPSTRRWMSGPQGRSSWRAPAGGSEPGMADDPFALLGDAGAACDEAGIAYAVIGAVARNAWAPPRATADLDL